MFFSLKMVSNRGAILHIFWRLKVRFRPVQTGSAGQCYALNLELDRRSSSTISLNFWTEPGVQVRTLVQDRTAASLHTEKCALSRRVLEEAEEAKSRKIYSS